MSKQNKSRKQLARHFKDRMQERYGLTVNNNDMNQIKQMIANGSATLILRQSTQRTVFLVNFRNQPVYVVYDKTRSHVMTALSHEMIYDEDGNLLLETRNKYE